MKIIYDASTAQKIRNILKREDIYVTMDVEGNCVAFCLKQQMKDGTERICDHAMFHIPEEA